MDSINRKPVASYSLRELWELLEDRLRHFNETYGVPKNELALVELIAGEAFRLARKVAE